MAEDSKPSPFIVQAPFDDRTVADIVLRSSDGVDFFASKVILAIASPIFRDMFSLPSAAHSAEKCSDGDEEMKDGLPVVTMYEEAAAIVDTLLRLLYPIDEPRFDSFKIISEVAAAAKKYEMTMVSNHIVETVKLMSLSNDAVKIMQAYFLAFHLDFKERVQFCARESLKYPIIENTLNVPGCSTVSGIAVWNYMCYRRRVEAEVIKIITSDYPYPPSPNAPIFSGLDYTLEPLNVKTCRECQARSDPHRRFTTAWEEWSREITKKLITAPLMENVITQDSLVRAIANTTGHCTNCRNEATQKSCAMADILSKRLYGRVIAVKF